MAQIKVLLEKTRKINGFLQRYSEGEVNYEEMAKMLSNLLDASVFVLNRNGEILGDFYLGAGVAEGEFLEKGYFPETFNLELLKIDATIANRAGKDFCQYEEENCLFVNEIVTVVPLSGGGERLGTIVFTKSSGEFTDADLLIAEYGGMVVGMEILRERSERIESEVRKKAACQIAIGTLSFSEQGAVEHIFEELGGSEGLLVASKVADSVGITRSVIVNALRKLESAGVIESRSLGMKGTYIRVLNEYFLEELEKYSIR